MGEGLKVGDSVIEGEKYITTETAFYTSRRKWEFLRWCHIQNRLLFFEIFPINISLCFNVFTHRPIFYHRAY